jgi:hypothetical protein
MKRSPFVAYYRGRSRLFFWLLATALCYSAIGPAGGCNKYAAVAAGYRMTLLVRSQGAAADKAVAHWLESHRIRCLKAHGPKTQAYGACFRPRAATARKWITAAAGLTAANLTAQAALRAAHLCILAAPGCKKGDPLRIGGVVVCGAAKALRALAPVIPALQKIASQLAALEGVTCAFR